MNWHQWLNDWYVALRELGYVARNDDIKQTRKRLMAKGLLNNRALYMQKADQGVYLYNSVEDVPIDGRLEFGFQDRSDLPKSILRIVQGRRIDPSRGVKRLEDKSATGIVPKTEFEKREFYFVDFDGGLFQADEENGWKETLDVAASELYRSYRGESPHYQSIRSYGKARVDCPTLLSNCSGKTLLGFDESSPITKEYKLI